MSKEKSPARLDAGQEASRDTVTEPAAGVVMHPQYDSSLCPPWCAGEHLRTAATGDFHHDGESKVLWVTHAPATADQHVSVVPSALVNDAGQQGPPLVELHIDGTLATLSASEARRLAQWLGDAADLAEPPSNEVIVAELRATMERFRLLEEQVSARIEARRADA